MGVFMWHDSSYLCVQMISGCYMYLNTLRVERIKMLACQLHLNILFIPFSQYGSAVCCTLQFVKSNAWLVKYSTCKQTNTCGVTAVSNLTTHSTQLDYSCGFNSWLVLTKPLEWWNKSWKLHHLLKCLMIHWRQNRFYQLNKLILLISLQ